MNQTAAAQRSISYFNNFTQFKIQWNNELLGITSNKKPSTFNLFKPCQRYSLGFVFFPLQTVILLKYLEQLPWFICHTDPLCNIPSHTGNTSSVLDIEFCLLKEKRVGHFYSETFENMKKAFIEKCTLILHSAKTLVKLIILFREDFSPFDKQSL